MKLGEIIEGEKQKQLHEIGGKWGDCDYLWLRERNLGEMKSVELQTRL